MKRMARPGPDGCPNPAVAYYELSRERAGMSAELRERVRQEAGVGATK